MPTLDELTFLDATALADLVRRKEVKPIELVDATIERIERVNPKLNAVVAPMYDQARAAAQDDIPDGPFGGVPFLLKDLVAAYAGVRMTSGSAFLRDFVPDHDSELVRRQKRAGLIVVGKTNAPEFGILCTTEPLLFGPTRNPWDVNRTTGGSSGGSAAAVAAGIVPMAHANDGGGSIRIPASCCGLFGLKPTRARNPLGPDLGDMMGGFVCEHAVTRSVRDSAALLDATAGPDVGDPYWAPPQARPFLQEVGPDPRGLRQGGGGCGEALHRLGPRRGRGGAGDQHLLSASGLQRRVVVGRCGRHRCFCFRHRAGPGARSVRAVDLGPPRKGTQGDWLRVSALSAHASANRAERGALYGKV